MLDRKKIHLINFKPLFNDHDNKYTDDVQQSSSSPRKTLFHLTYNCLQLHSNSRSDLQSACAESNLVMLRTTCKTLAKFRKDRNSLL
ncbi:hypothetical protein CW304_02640 [Bacillus sp. UFRGS-B20]|nr:hypothetical protein CW304_02640 [Bacillus sp. UFRGS-B20]